MHVRLAEENKMKWVYIIFLFICAVWDIRVRKIPVIWLYGGLLWMGIYAGFQLIQKERGMLDLIFALLPGVICCLFAKVSHAVGMGDALIMIGIGLCFAVMSVLRILTVAFFLAAIGSVIVMIMQRRIENKRIPFVPYLLLASGFVLIG